MNCPQDGRETRRKLEVQLPSRAPKKRVRDVAWSLWHVVAAEVIPFGRHLAVQSIVAATFLGVPPSEGG
jgi:hypothetical protein